MPREVQWRGQTVRTAIWKSPASGRIRVGKSGFSGDGQADLVGHGGEHRAVMVYQLDSYRYWAEKLQRSDFVHGQFGENLTVEGLPDTDVCIGDRFRIGSAVFEVTQPRVTCFKVGIRLDNPQMAALLVAHRRPGFYFRVIQEGEVAAGDAIEKIAVGEAGLSVAAVDALLYTSSHPVETLERAVNIPALSEGWRSSFRALLDAARQGVGGSNAGLAPVLSGPPAWQGFRKLRIIAAQYESQDVRSFTLAAEDGSSLPPALPGQHLIVRVYPDEAVVRNYSLCGSPRESTYRIAVKREIGGRASNYLHQHRGVGDELEVSAPRGTFTLSDDSQPVVLISAGIGVTPVLAMLQALVCNPRPAWWIHCARDKAHHSFSTESRELLQQKRLASGSSVVIYSRPDAADRIGVDYDRQGHLDLAVLRELDVPVDGTFYLCGPAAFLEKVSLALRDYGVDPARIRVELFGAGPATGGPVKQSHPPPGLPGHGPTVTFTRSGLSVPWDSRFNSLLELAEACDVPVRWSCRTGVCHYCETSLVEGEVRYSPAPIDPPGTDRVLICCSTPRSATQLDL
jgi:ferredoxin-NADP reductase/MOSC domain-containing protein YiiM